MNTPIVYSHGFGVEKTARGMFDDISRQIPYRSHILFNYNITTEDGIKVVTFEDQKQILQKEIDKAKEKGAKYIDIIGHSQGAIAITLLDNTDFIRKAIFITPPRELSLERTEKNFGNREGVLRHTDGKLMKVPRRDGSMTTIPLEFWDNFLLIDLPRLYEKFTSKVPTFVIMAENDEVLGSDKITDKLTKTIKSQIIIPGNHDFTGLYRTGLIDVVKNILNSK